MDIELKLAAAEFIAAFALIFIGAGVVLANAATAGAIGVVGIALAHGLVLMSMIYALAHISGAHANPAVTIAVWANKLMPTKRAAQYIVAQLLGATVAGLLLAYIFSGLGVNLSAGAPALASSVDMVKGIVIEAVLTFFLVFTIFGVAVDKKAPPAIYGLAIGLVLTFDILMGGVLTGAAMNPARAFGPALAAGFWDNQLVYWIGPIIGGLVAGFVYNMLYLTEGKQKRK